MQTFNKTGILVISTLILGGITGYLVGYERGLFSTRINKIDSFEKCVAAGYPIAESYPRQCFTPDGKGFTERIDPEPIACTLEAKLCPDGSYVGRTGPKCEFSACPAVGEFWGNIMGTVLLGPTCPVVQDPPDPKCADKKFQTRLVVTTTDGARVIKEFSSDARGKFNIEIAPGKYAIRSAAAANVLPYCTTNETIVVTANGTTETVVYCDTGIR